MNTKQYIIELSKEYSIVTQFTSFVAIEKREKDETVAEDAPTMEELVEKEDVDELAYMGFERVSMMFGQTGLSRQNRPRSDTTDSSN